MKMPNYLAVFMLLGLLPAASAQSPQTTGALTYPSPLPALASVKCVQKVYSVADLVIPIDSMNQPACAATGCAAPVQLQDPSVYAKQLIKQLMMLKPETWECNGGCGKVEYYPIGHALIVCQTADVQERVAALLQSLRKLQDTQVMMEIHFLRVSPEFMERVGMAMPCPPAPQTVRQVGADGLERIGVDFAQPVQAQAKTCVWDHEQLQKFMEAVKADCRTSVMQAPKLTVLNGQNARVECGQSQMFVTGMKVEECKGRKLYVPVNEALFLGTRCEVIAVAKENGKEVMLHFKASVSEQTGPTALHPVASTIEAVGPSGDNRPPVPFTQFIQKPCVQTLVVDRTATVPVNCTLVMPAGTFLREERVEHKVPVLGDIPYVNRMFRNVGVGRVCESVVVLVTPRIICQSEAEVRATNTSTCLTGVGCNTSSGMTGSVCAVPCASSLTAPCPAPEMLSAVVRLRNACAADVAPALQTFFAATSSVVANGSALKPTIIVAEPVSNCLLVGGSPECCRRVMRMIEQLDVPAAQVPPVCADSCAVPVGRYYPGGFQTLHGMTFRGGGHEMCRPVLANERTFYVGFVDNGTVPTPPTCSVKSPAMNMADIVALSSSNVSDEIINNQIQTTGVHFTLSTEDILWLKKNKVSDSVVSKMQGTRPQPWSDPAPVPPTLVTPMPMPAPSYSQSPYAPAQFTPPLPPTPVPYFPPPVMPAPLATPSTYIPTMPAPLPAPAPTMPSAIPYLKPVKAVPPPALPPVPPLRGNETILPAKKTRADNASPDQQLFNFWLGLFANSAPTPMGPRPIGLDFGFPIGTTRDCPLPCQTTEKSKPTGSFMIGRGVSSDAGVTGSFIVNERNFDVKRARSQQASEIGEQLIGAAAELVTGVATFVGDELPAILTDAGESVRPKVKLTVGIKLESAEISATQAPTQTRMSVGFSGPKEMLGYKLTWFGVNDWNETPLVAPARYNFVQGRTYRLKMTSVPDDPSKVYYPTLEVAEALPNTRDYVAHRTVFVNFTPEDLEEVNAGNFLVKAVYLPNADNRDMDAIKPAELVSTQLKPGADVVAEARKRGTVLLVVRMGITDSDPTNQRVAPSR